MNDSLNTSNKIAFVIPDQTDLQHVIKLRGIARIGIQPNLGVCSVATVAANAGWDVKIFDNYLWRQRWWDLGQKILEYDPVVVGFSISSLNIMEGRQLLNFLRKHSSGIVFVVGGLYPTLCSEDCLEYDYVISGEGELKFLEFLEYGIKREKLFQFPQILKANRIEHLDSLPIPNRNLFDEGYLPEAANLLGVNVQNIFTARGCKFQCRFCHNSSSCDWSLKFRSAEKIVEEIRYVRDTTNASGIYFVEDTFTADTKRVLALAEIFQKPENSDLLELDYLAYARISPLSNEVLEALASMNFRGLFLGIESGSDRTLKEIRKGYKVKTVNETLDRIKRVGIKFGSGFMIGFPHETEDDIKRTLDLAMDDRHSYVYFQTYCGLPVSELYYECQELDLVEEWFGRIFAARTLHVSRETLRQYEEEFPLNRDFKDWPVDEKKWEGNRRYADYEIEVVEDYNK